MAYRGIWIGLLVAVVLGAVGCGSSTPTSPAPMSSPTAAPARTKTPSAVAAGMCLDDDSGENALPRREPLSVVLTRGVPSEATLCYSFEPPNVRTLDGARTYRALRAATTDLPGNELLATDATYGLLTLEYPSGHRSRLIVDGSTLSVIEPDATSPSGDRMLFLRNGYAKAFSPFE